MDGLILGDALGEIDGLAEGLGPTASTIILQTVIVLALVEAGAYAQNLFPLVILIAPLLSLALVPLL
jgi:hypothetical protein